MIYVDQTFVCESRETQARFVGTRTGHQWCHMWCETGYEEVLHDVAAKIGLRRSWFQDKPGFPHYDLVPGKRLLALKNGAVEKHLIDWLRQRRRAVREVI